MATLKRSVDGLTLVELDDGDVATMARVLFLYAEQTRHLAAEGEAEGAWAPAVRALRESADTYEELSASLEEADLIVYPAPDCDDGRPRPLLPMVETIDPGAANDPPPVCEHEQELWGPHEGCAEFMGAPEAIVQCGKPATRIYFLTFHGPDGDESEAIFACDEHDVEESAYLTIRSEETVG